MENNSVKEKMNHVKFQLKKEFEDFVIDSITNKGFCEFSIGEDDDESFPKALVGHVVHNLLIHYYDIKNKINDQDDPKNCLPCTEEDTFNDFLNHPLLTNICEQCDLKLSCSVRIYEDDGNERTVICYMIYPQFNHVHGMY